MSETIEGKLTVWRTRGPLEEMVFELSADLTADGERLIVVDAAGCFDPGRVSRASASVARNLHVIRVASGGELQTAVWAALRAAQQRTRARRVLLAGVLDHLYGREILTRDAAHALGRIKRLLETLARSGMDVTVVCKTEKPDLGARTYLLSSLCASAHEVRYWPSAAEESIDSASAAIA